MRDLRLVRRAHDGLPTFVSEPRERLRPRKRELVVALLLIDMEDVGFGHPAADLANARSRLLFNYEGSPIALQVWESIIASYFEGAEADEIADVDRWFAILSEIERFGHVSKAFQAVGDDERGARLREYMDRNVERVEELLPQVSRLDF